MNFIIKTTTECNFRCTYCSEGNQKPQNLPLPVFQKLVDEIPTLLSDKKEELTILWHGGEPLLWGRERLDAAMTYAEEKLAGYNLHFSMQSNGYLLDHDETLKMLDKHHVRVGISLDGYQENHDAVRQTKEGYSTWNQIIENIKRLQEMDLFGGILMVYRGEEDPGKVFDFLEHTGIPCKINPLLHFGRAADQEKESQKKQENYVDFLIQLYKFSVQSDAKIIIDPIEKILDAILGRSPIQECSFSGTCGKNILCLYADGKMGLCGRDSETREFIYGDLNSQSLLDIYHTEQAEKVRRRSQYIREHDCGTCDIFQYCHGGCPYEALHSSGNLLQKFPYCNSRKRLIHFLETDGLLLLKQRLLREKRLVRRRISVGQKLQEKLAYEG